MASTRAWCCSSTSRSVTEKVGHTQTGSNGGGEGRRKLERLWETTKSLPYERQQPTAVVVGLFLVLLPLASTPTSPTSYLHLLFSKRTGRPTHLLLRACNKSQWKRTWSARKRGWKTKAYWITVSNKCSWLARFFMLLVCYQRHLGSLLSLQSLSTLFA